MQIVNVVNCGMRLEQTPVMLEDGSVNLVDSHTYYLNGTPSTFAEWNGDSVTVEPFTMSSPWDYIFKNLIDIYGVSLIGKTLTLDVTDIDGNILKVR